MKTISKLLILTSGLLVAAPFIHAADATTSTGATTPSVSSPAKHHGHRQAAMRHRRALQKKIAHKLNLSADQKTQFKTIGANTRSAVKAVHDNTTLTPEQKKSQVRELVQSARAQRIAVLTPDQKTKLEQMKARVWQRMGGI
jgi:Spy/CpxP family protein refolding chaperone